MEIFKNEMIRKRILVNVGNPIIATEKMIEEYNAVCALVEKYFVSRLTLGETNVEVQNGSVVKQIHYNKLSNVEWLGDKLKEIHDELVYNHRADVKRVLVMTNKRSKELSNAIAYALTLDPKIIKQDDDVVLTADTLTYVFNLNNISFKERKKVDDMFTLQRLEALAKKHNL